MTVSVSPPRYSLGAYLAFAFSFMSVLLTVILAAVIERTASRQVAETLGANLAELAHQTASRLDRSMFERYREVESMSRRLSGVSEMALVRREIDALQASYPYYAWIGLTDNTGKVQAATRGMLDGIDVSKQPWHANAYKGRFVGDVHEAVLLAKLLGGNGNEPLRFVDLAFPMTLPDGRAGGVLGAHLSWEWARDVERTIFVPLDSTRVVQPLVLANDGAVLLGPASIQGKQAKLESFKLAVAGGTGHVIERWPDGGEFLVGYSSTKGYAAYPGLGWTVAVREPLSEAYEPVRALQGRVVGGGLLVALLFSLLGWYAAKVITRPLLQLAESADGLKSDGAAQVMAADSYSEVGRLGDSLNTMLGNLQRRDAELRELNATLERRVEARTAELREAFQQVKQNEQRIHTIIESAQDPFVGMDFEGRITDWNSQAQILFGWTREEVLGRPLASTLLPPRFVPAAEKALQVFVASGRTDFVDRRIERVMLDRQGREIPVEVKLGLVNTGSMRFFSAFVHDISQRKEIERLKSEFLSTVSHELRTPLTGIFGSMSLLQSGMAGELPEDARELIAMSHRSCERLLGLINDVMDIEKIDAGLLAYEMEHQPLLPMVEKALADIAPYAQQHDVVVALPAPVPGLQVRADAGRIVQVLVNLQSNAVKFSPAGGEVRVELAQRDGFARVAVIDHGSGVPPQFHDRLFERFAQADGSDRREKGGTGLGLSICRSIVQAHGGHIGCISEPGVRTEFFFELPLVA